jgi:hypothetical protein
VQVLPTGEEQVAAAVAQAVRAMPTSEEQMAAAAAAAVDRWLTRPEVAERIKIPPKTLAEWASQKKGPPFSKFGRWTRYRLSDVIAWENRQLTGGDAA